MPVRQHSASDNMEGRQRKPEQVISPQLFQRRFFVLILLAWTVPPVFGLSFLLFIGMFTPAQMAVILTTPLEPIFIVATTAFALVYFIRFGAPIRALLGAPHAEDPAPALACMHRFPVDFWAVFLGYLLLAPASVVLSASRYTDFVAQPMDWFRIHLVALVVSIIVGLPIFFSILDLFGRVVQRVDLHRVQVTVGVKVFLIGTLMPLLVDTLVVQYYWTRTGYFSSETLVVWLSLELLAVVGSLMFARSFARALAPLQEIVQHPGELPGAELQGLRPRSTDEIGVLTTGYRRLLEDLHVRNEMLEISNRMLRSVGDRDSVAEVMESVIELCRTSVGGDTIFLILYDADTDELVGVVQTGLPYNRDGHFRLSPTTRSMAVWAFRHGETAAIPDVHADPRTSPELRQRYQLRSALAVPLHLEGRVIGVLMTTSSTHQRDYSQQDILLMEALAREVALAVHTQMLYQERVAADAARVEREEKVRLLLDYTAEAIFGVDLEGRCTFVNPACLRMLGYEREEQLLGRNMHALIHHTYPNGVPYPKERCRVRLATLSGASSHCTTEVHWRADGTSFPVEYWSHPIYKNGEIIGTVVTFVDITERREAEQELRRLSQSNRLLLESTSDGIFGVDTELRCTFVNRAAADMLGFAPDELRDADIHELFHHSRENGTPLDRHDSLIYRAIHEDRSFWSDNEVLWNKAGELFPVQYSANPIHEEGRVTGAAVVFRNVAEARAMARKMDYLATHDALTGLYNRREFEHRLEQALASVQHDGQQHALCYMDLDQFKVVNDTCGHVAGDELLRQLTALLYAKVRHADTLARLGGDEFGVLLECCGLDDALPLANELRCVVQDFRFVWENNTFSVGASVGVVAIRADTENAATALSAADAACYMAKDSGRNRVRVYEADDAELARRRGEMQWVSRIHEALDQGRLILSYQPIVPVRQNDETGGMHFEVLLRMRDGDGGSIPPGAFLPAAERYNLMPTLDRWVVRTTFAWLRTHAGRLRDLELCTINLSGHSLGDADFLEFVVAELAAAEIPAHKICFEVTETAAVANLSQAATFMRRLRRHGCRFALDDFGSGMSSFAYLKNLPVDFLKIDGNFVRDLVRDPIDRAMVAAINQVGHVMGIRTIAEFVEDDEILEQLQHIGVDYAQGYGIAAPQLLETLLPLLPTVEAVASGD